MAAETIFRLAFLLLLVALIAMRATFMIRVRRSGERLMPDQQAVKREGGRGILVLRAGLLFALIGFLLMYFLGAAWIDAFAFRLPGWLRWTGFGLGLLSVAFWTWTQVVLDTQWSAQLQLTRQHHLITTGPYARIRHPLYTAMCGWAIALALLTSNWILVTLAGLSIAGTLARVPKEEQMMLEAFGDEYRDYMHRTGRYFPRP
jgi:protein-S-isoprenylcysteine O-methyltransferase Ste14